DAGGELVIDAMKQARDRVIWRNLAAPRSVLDDLVADETRAGAASVPLHPLQLTERSPRIMAERRTIHRAEASLRREAPRAIRDIFKASKTKSDQMAVQIKRLVERYPFLHLLSLGDVPSRSWEFDARQFTTAQENRLRSLEKIRPFVDDDSINQLSR